MLPKKQGYNDDGFEPSMPKKRGRPPKPRDAFGNIIYNKQEQPVSQKMSSASSAVKISIAGSSVRSSDFTDSKYSGPKTYKKTEKDPMSWLESDESQSEEEEVQSNGSNFISSPPKEEAAPRKTYLKRSTSANANLSRRTSSRKAHAVDVEGEILILLPNSNPQALLGLSDDELEEFRAMLANTQESDDFFLDLGGDGHGSNSNLATLGSSSSSSSSSSTAAPAVGVNVFVPSITERVTPHDVLSRMKRGGVDGSLPPKKTKKSNSTASLSSSSGANPSAIVNLAAVSQAEQVRVRDEEDLFNLISIRRSNGYFVEPTTSSRHYNVYSSSSSSSRFQHNGTKASAKDMLGLEEVVQNSVKNVDVSYCDYDADSDDELFVSTQLHSKAVTLSTVTDGSRRSDEYAVSLRCFEAMICVLERELELAKSFGKVKAVAVQHLTSYREQVFRVVKHSIKHVNRYLLEEEAAEKDPDFEVASAHRSRSLAHLRQIVKQYQQELEQDGLDLSQIPQRGGGGTSGSSSNNGKRSAFAHVHRHLNGSSSRDAANYDENGVSSGGADGEMMAAPYDDDDAASRSSSVAAQGPRSRGTSPFSPSDSQRSDPAVTAAGEEGGNGEDVVTGGVGDSGDGSGYNSLGLPSEENTEDGCLGADALPVLPAAPRHFDGRVTTPANVDFDDAVLEVGEAMLEGRSDWSEAISMLVSSDDEQQQSEPARMRSINDVAAVDDSHAAEHSSSASAAPVQMVLEIATQELVACQGPPSRSSHAGLEPKKKIGRGGRRKKNLDQDHLDPIKHPFFTPEQISGMVSEQRATQLLVEVFSHYDQRGVWLTTDEEASQVVVEFSRRVYQYWLKKRSGRQMSFLRCYHNYINSWEQQRSLAVPLAGAYMGHTLRLACDQIATVKQDLEMARVVLDRVRRREKWKREVIRLGGDDQDSLNISPDAVSYCGALLERGMQSPVTEYSSSESDNEQILLPVSDLIDGPDTELLPAEPLFSRLKNTGDHVVVDPVSEIESPEVRKDRRKRAASHDEVTSTVREDKLDNNVAASGGNEEVAAAVSVVKKKGGRPPKHKPPPAVVAAAAAGSSEVEEISPDQREEQPVDKERRGSGRWSRKGPPAEEAAPPAALAATENVTIAPAVDAMEEEHDETPEKPVPKKRGRKPWKHLLTSSSSTAAAEANTTSSATAAAVTAVPNSSAGTAAEPIKKGRKASALALVESSDEQQSPKAATKGGSKAGATAVKDGRKGPRGGSRKVLDQMETSESEAEQRTHTTRSRAASNATSSEPSAPVTATAAKKGRSSSIGVDAEPRLKSPMNKKQSKRVVQSSEEEALWSDSSQESVPVDRPKGPGEKAAEKSLDSSEKEDRDSVAAVAQVVENVTDPLVIATTTAPVAVVAAHDEDKIAVPVKGFNVRKHTKKDSSSSAEAAEESEELKAVESFPAPPVSTGSLESSPGTAKESVAVASEVAPTIPNVDSEKEAIRAPVASLPTTASSISSLYSADGAIDAAKVSQGWQSLFASMNRGHPTVAPAAPDARIAAAGTSGVVNETQTPSASAVGRSGPSDAVSSIWAVPGVASSADLSPKVIPLKPSSAGMRVDRVTIRQDAATPLTPVHLDAESLNNILARSSILSVPVVSGPMLPMAPPFLPPSYSHRQSFGGQPSGYLSSSGYVSGSRGGGTGYHEEYPSEGRALRYSSGGDSGRGYHSSSHKISRKRSSSHRYRERSESEDGSNSSNSGESEDSSRAGKRRRGSHKRRRRSNYESDSDRRRRSGGSDRGDRRSSNGHSAHHGARRDRNRSEDENGPEDSHNHDRTPRNSTGGVADSVLRQSQSSGSGRLSSVVGFVNGSTTPSTSSAFAPIAAVGVPAVGGGSSSVMAVPVNSLADLNAPTPQAVASTKRGDDMTGDQTKKRSSGKRRRHLSGSRDRDDRQDRDRHHHRNNSGSSNHRDRSGSRREYDRVVRHSSEGGSSKKRRSSASSTRRFEDSADSGSSSSTDSYVRDDDASFSSD